MGWVGSGHTRWTHGQLWAYNRVYVRRAQHLLNLSRHFAPSNPHAGSLTGTAPPFHSIFFSYLNICHHTPPSLRGRIANTRCGLLVAMSRGLSTVTTSERPQLVQWYRTSNRRPWKDYLFRTTCSGQYCLHICLHQSSQPRRRASPAIAIQSQNCTASAAVAQPSRVKRSR